MRFTSTEAHCTAGRGGALFLRVFYTAIASRMVLGLLEGTLPASDLLIRIYISGVPTNGPQSLEASMLFCTFYSG